MNYVVGEVSREAGGARPEYLPYGYLVGDTTSIALNLASLFIIVERNEASQ